MSRFFLHFIWQIFYEPRKSKKDINTNRPWSKWYASSLQSHYGICDLSKLIFQFKLLSRTKAADDPLKKKEQQESQKNKLPEFEDFLNSRDYSGAVTLLEVFEVFLQIAQNACFNLELNTKVFSELWKAHCKYGPMDRLL